jgi:hypothetical protein
MGASLPIAAFPGMRIARDDAAPGRLDLTDTRDISERAPKNVYHTVLGVCSE